MRVVIGIGGGIAAYKAAMLLRLFSKAGHQVVAIPTDTALKFVGKPTLEALSGNPVTSDLFDRVDQVNHVAQAEQADAVLIAPATADLMARLAAGRADDLLAATVLTTHAPVILAPAMHTQMWEHPATQANVATLRSYGYSIIEPAVGRLTGPDSGVGRLPEPEDIFARALEILGWEGEEAVTAGEQPLAGRHLVITAGGTREPLDPVRFLGNRSSGKQGIALAQAAQALGATVHLIAAHCEVPLPQNLGKVTQVSTAAQLQEAVFEALPASDLLIMAAAVADFRPASYQAHKLKKTADPDQVPHLELVRNPDILRQVVEARQQNPALGPRLILGFAAETGDAQGSVLDYGRAKLVSKGCDFLAVNQVGEQLGFGQETNRVTLLAQGQDQAPVFEGSKYDLALQLLRHLAQYF